MFDGGEQQLQQLMIRNSSSPTTAAARTSLTLPPPFISSPNNFHNRHHVSSFFDPPPPHGSFLQYPPATAALSPHDLQPRKLDNGGGGFHLGMNNCMDQEVVHHHPWSTDELVALFRIRSSFYNWFPQFTWEHVSRKMAELGYKRSGDKCKEKFELESRSSCFNNNNANANTTTTTASASANNNNYRIFTELDELICHGDDHNQDHPHDHDHTDDDDDDDDDEKVDNDDQQKHMIPPAVVHTKPKKPTDQKLIMTSSTADKDSIMMGQDLERDTQDIGATTADHHALVNSNHDDDDDDGKLELDQNKIEEDVKRKRVEEEEEEEEEQEQEKEEDNYKNKKKMKKVQKEKVDNKFEILKGLCEDMVKKLMAQQEEMHNKLMQDMVKRDEEKVKREEAWKKQEMERMKKELDARAKEQQIAGERQTTLLNFLSKLAAASSTDHHPNGNNPPSTSSSSSSSLAVAQNPSTTIMAHTQQDQKPEHHHHEHEKDGRHTSTSSSNLSDPQLPKTSNQNPNTPVVTTVDQDHQQKEDHGGKRWPRDEVLALINIRCTLSNSSTNDQDQTKDNAGSRAPLWERISQGMLEMGYKRSSKRCKEKWENINKYFRKTKDSSKKRSLDSRTCPYFHQLSTLYSQGKLSLPENHSDQPAGGSGDVVQCHEKHVTDDQPAAGFGFEL